MGAVASAIWQRSVSHPRSSNRACQFPAPGFPTDFTERHTGNESTTRGVCAAIHSLSPIDTATSDGSGLQRCCQAYRQSPRPLHLRKRTRSQSPSLRRHCPASTVIRPCPTPAKAAACRNVEAATLAHDGSPPITRIILPTCRAHYPGGLSGCACRLLPRSLRPSPNGRRVGIHIVTFKACSGFTHVTARWIAQPPKATFVTRLQPCRLPSRAARQLPDQSTTLWMESSSTDNPRLRGALPKADSCTAEMASRFRHGSPT